MDRRSSPAMLYVVLLAVGLGATLHTPYARAFDSNTAQIDGGAEQMCRDAARLTQNFLVNKGLRPGCVLPDERLHARALARWMIDEMCGTASKIPSTTLPGMGLKTDYWTAFREGWALHFDVVSAAKVPGGSPVVDLPQPFGEAAQRARQFAARMREEMLALKGPYRLPVPGRWPGGASLTFPIWHGRYHHLERIALIASNSYVYEPDPRFALSQCRPWPRTAAALEAVAPLHPRNGVRSAAGMLATEGVVAAFFHRFVSDPRIQAYYRPLPFYLDFMPPGATPAPGALPSDIFSPEQNAYLKAIHVIATSIRPGLIVDRPSPLLVFVSEYARRFPEEAEVVYELFLSTTGGATVSPDPGGIPFERQSADWRLQELKKGLVAGTIRIDAAVGPQIWLMNRNAGAGFSPYDQFGAFSLPHSFDLNAANRFDLLRVPGIDPETADAILSARGKKGFFASVDELSGIPSVGPEVVPMFRDMEQDMSAWVEEKSIDAGEAVRRITITYVRAGTVRMLPALSGVLLAYLITSAARRASEARHLGRWSPPSWLDRGYPRWIAQGAGAAFRLLLLCAGSTALLVALPPGRTVERAAMAVALSSVVWLVGAVPQIVGISAFAGLSRAYLAQRLVWSFITMLAVTFAAFLLT